ncbi:MAG TPA: EamA family transporter [Frankiaceae bacterium]|nr:EamA family transporter [Frankiaceae bacterium]
MSTPRTTAGSRRRVPAPALVLAAVLSVQTGAALAKSLFADLGPTGATTVRLLSGTVLLLLIWRPRVPPSGRLLIVGYGLALGCMNLSFYLALDRIPLGAAVTVEFLGPLAVAVGGSRRPRDGVAALLAAVGIVFLARGGTGSLDPAGLALAALAGACWAAYIIFSSAAGKRSPGGTPLALAMVVASAVVLPFGIGSAVDADASALLRGAAVGLLSSVIPYSLELEALRSLPPRAFGVLLSLEPAAAALSGLVFLDESLAVRQWVGIGCVVIASVAATLSARLDAPVPA